MGFMEKSRFQDTLAALRDCKAYMGDKNLSEEEEEARSQLFLVCTDVANEYGD